MGCSTGPVRYGQALAECEAVASVGSKGDSYDNALAEALNSMYKTKLRQIIWIQPIMNR